MWKPETLGTVIAERELQLVQQGETKTVILRLGQPVRSPTPEEGDPWICPVAFEGLGPAGKIHPICGFDSVQALVLALDFGRKVLPDLARQVGGTLTWLSDEEDLISPQRDQIEANGRAAGDAFEVVRHVEKALRLRTEPDVRELHGEVSHFLRKYGAEK